MTIFKPQVLYKDRNVRQIFDKFAHSSIMKLNETSMGTPYSVEPRAPLIWGLCGRSEVLLAQGRV